MAPAGYYREKPNGILNKPRVLYVSGAFIGFRQRIPPRIPDVVKLDWQIRLVKMLAAMKIELKARCIPVAYCKVNRIQ